MPCTSAPTPPIAAQTLMFPPTQIPTPTGACILSPHRQRVTPLHSLYHHCHLHPSLSASKSTTPSPPLPKKKSTAMVAATRRPRQNLHHRQHCQPPMRSGSQRATGRPRAATPTPTSCHCQWPFARPPTSARPSMQSSEVWTSSYCRFHSVDNREAAIHSNPIRYGHGWVTLERSEDTCNRFYRTPLAWVPVSDRLPTRAISPMLSAAWVLCQRLRLLLYPAHPEIG